MEIFDISSPARFVISHTITTREVTGWGRAVHNMWHVGTSHIPKYQHTHTIFQPHITSLVRHITYYQKLGSVNTMASPLVTLQT